MLVVLDYCEDAGEKKGSEEGGFISIKGNLDNSKVLRMENSFK